ncbi:MAG: hypothetical protein QM535_17385 [Limnohabitans sp.]|nr:hypothetical protein [Limnohabitans sp.]
MKTDGINLFTKIREFRFNKAIDRGIRLGEGEINFLLNIRFSIIKPHNLRKGNTDDGEIIAMKYYDTGNDYIKLKKITDSSTAVVTLKLKDYNEIVEPFLQSLKTLYEVIKNTEFFEIDIIEAVCVMAFEKEFNKLLLAEEEKPNALFNIWTMKTKPSLLFKNNVSLRDKITKVLLGVDVCGSKNAENHLIAEYLEYCGTLLNYKFFIPDIDVLENILNKLYLFDYIEKVKNTEIYKCLKIFYK